MGSKYRSAHKKSPERLTLTKINKVSTRMDSIQITATFNYEPWFDATAGEMSDAVETLTRVVEVAADKAYVKREAKLKEEHEEVLTQLSSTKATE